MQVECNGLQKECSVLRSEKQDVANTHQKERSSLQTECASLRAEKEELLKTHQKEKGNLQTECAALRSEKEALLQKQKQLEKDLARSVHQVTLSRAQLHPPPLCSLWLVWLCYTVYHTPLFVWSFTYWTQCYFVSGSSHSQNAELNNGIKALEISQQELEKRLAALQLQHQQDSTRLQTQLDEADSRSKTLQREVYSQTKKSFTKCQAPQNHPLFLRLRILLPSDLTVALCLHLLRFGHIFHSCNWLTDIVPL